MSNMYWWANTIMAHPEKFFDEIVNGEHYSQCWRCWLADFLEEFGTVWLELPWNKQVGLFCLTLQFVGRRWMVEWRMFIGGDKLNAHNVSMFSSHKLRNHHVTHRTNGQTHLLPLSTLPPPPSPRVLMLYHGLSLMLIAVYQGRFSFFFI